MAFDQQVSEPPQFVIFFDPESMGAVTRFRYFAHTTYRFRKETQDALRGIEGHFQKYLILRGLAERLIPTLREDMIELKERGYSPAKHSKELAALIETIFCELYSSLDCMREVVRAVFRSLGRKPPQGIPKAKTSKLFSNAAQGKLDPGIPNAIATALTEAHNTWFPQLRGIRTQVTHFDIGSCRIAGDEKVSYVHFGLGSRERAFMIEDVFGRLTEFEIQVNELLGVVFTELLKTLQDIPTEQICGFFEGRLYQRLVSPREAVDRNSGICLSYKWFEQHDLPTCPLANSCGAYAPAKSHDRSDQ
jgi:hypothetical protein